jgi:hypothetical protein
MYRPPIHFPWWSPLSAALCTFLLILSASLAPAQAIEHGSLSGKITDPMGASVPGASITLTNEGTNASTRVTSSASGEYQFPLVSAGTYTLKATAMGFAVVTNQHLAIANGQQARQDLTIPVGAATTEVTSIQTEPRVKFKSANPTKSVLTALGDCNNDFVRVSLSGVQGPMGYVPAPSLGTTTQIAGTDPELVLESRNYNYPSLILYVSAIPVVCVDTPPADQQTADEIAKGINESSQETDRNPQWLDATFTLSAFDEKDNLITDACIDDKTVKILTLLPQQTVAGLKNQTVADITATAAAASGAIAPLSPGVGSVVAGATKALNVVFQDIFPPRPIAYQYSYMKGNCSFGWFFRPNPNSTAGKDGEASILGTQEGIILLKVDPKVKKLTVTGMTLSSWSKDASKTSKKLFLSPQETINFQLYNQTTANYDGITDLTLFPALISKSTAEKILHITNDTDWQALLKDGKLTPITPDGAYVTNTSLSALIVATPKASGKPDTTNINNVGGNTTNTPEKPNTTNNGGGNNPTAKPAPTSKDTPAAAPKAGNKENSSGGKKPIPKIN